MQNHFDVTAPTTNHGGNVDVVSIRIDRMLDQQSSSLSDSCIYRVHSSLRNVNKLEYEPILLSVGPYHRKKRALQEMEKYKLHYLKSLLERMNENSVERLVTEMRSMVERARSCYGATFEIDNDDEFIEMMVLDGCFIIELFRKFSSTLSGDEITGDPIFCVKWYMNCLWRDLLLFENQLPLFVLHKLFELTKAEGEVEKFYTIAIRFFIPGETPNIDENSHLEIRHILGLFYKSIVPSTSNSTNGLERNSENCQSSRKFIPNASILYEARVEFKATNKNIFEITFNKGVLEIPELEIQDTTECLFRNLIAYEQYSGNHSLHRVTDYLLFMNCLVNTSEDVKILCRHGIIDKNSLTDERVSTIFNQLGLSVYCESENFYYAEIFANMNKYCSRSYNLEMAKLWHQYFNSTWSLVSFLAAVLLLFLTATQTIFAILSYKSPGSGP